MEDYIKRKNAIDLLRMIIDVKDSIGTQGITVYDLMSIPSEKVRDDRVGRWKHVHDENAFPFFKDRWVCSVCDDWQTYGEPKYCPNCGARTLKENENEEIA